jgi:hypothetical protein
VADTNNHLVRIVDLSTGATSSLKLTLKTAEEKSAK